MEIELSHFLRLPLLVDLTAPSYYQHLKIGLSFHYLRCQVRGCYALLSHFNFDRLSSSHSAADSQVGMNSPRYPPPRPPIQCLPPLNQY